MEFFASDVTTLTGIKRPRQFQWIERGYLKPSIQGSAGTGTKNVYNRIDIYKFVLFKKLLEGGISRDTAAAIIKNFNHNVQAVPLTFKGADIVKQLEPDQNLLLVVSIKLANGKKSIRSFIHMTGKPIQVKERFTEETTLKASAYFYDKIRAEINDGADQIHIVNLSKKMIEIDTKI
ncbi:MAG: hypothetical protein ABII68_09150, partial [Pseudomonadota bacterium]